MSENQAGPGPTDRTQYDVVVVGGGGAGLSAALVLGRARRAVAVVDSGRPRNAPASHMQGYLGADGLPPRELIGRGREEVAAYAGHLMEGTVTAVMPVAPTSDAGGLMFEVPLDDGRSLRTRRVVVTTGLRDVVPDVPGVTERWGRDLLHCPYCHGYEVRDEPLGVLGGTPEAIAHAHLVRQWSPDVVLFTHGTVLTPEQRERLRARAIQVVEAPVARLVVEDDRLTGVEIVGGEVMARSAVFVRPHVEPHSTLLADLGCDTDEHGWTVVDGAGLTSVPGVWAAGNAVNPRAQVITAAGEGSAAAIAVNNDLVEEDVAIALTESRRNLTT